MWVPVLDGTRHAEIEALRRIPQHLRSRTREMTLYSTLEPCVMCAGAILLHHLGAVIFGAADPQGSSAQIFKSLPPYFRQAKDESRWLGPADPEGCDPLYVRSLQLLAERGKDRI